MYIFGTTAFYGGVYDGEQFLPKRLIQSVTNVPDSAPATFYDDFDDNIVAISSAKNNVIVLCENSIFRENGGFDLLGKGSLYHERISDVVGCVSANSVVKTEAGVFFAGTDGFYFTDGFQMIKISLEIDRTYAGLVKSSTQKAAIKGVYDSLNRLVFWSVCTSPSSKDADAIYVFHLNFGVKPSGCFSRFYNEDMLQPNALAFHDSRLVFADNSGYVFKTDPDQKADIYYSTAHSTWLDKHMPYDYLGCAIDMGTAFKRKWLTRLHVVGDNHGNVLAEPYIIRDKNFDYNGEKVMAKINYADNEVWGAPIKVWGTDEDHWGNYGKMDLWRRFPQTTLRADMVQIGLRPVYGTVYAWSVDYPEEATCDVDSVGKTAIIATPAGYTNIVWPTDAWECYICFDTDEYENEFLITDIAGDQITYSDASNLSSDNPLAKWEIRGYKKQQRPHISTMVVHYAYLGDENQSYPGAKTNMGPGNGGQNP